MLSVEQHHHLADFQGTQPKPKGAPRRHYFVSRVAPEVTTEALLEHCKKQNLSPTACRELPSQRPDVKSFHLILPESKSDLAELNETWPEHVILRRYFLNYKARSWIKTMKQDDQS